MAAVAGLLLGGALSWGLHAALHQPVPLRVPEPPRAKVSVRKAPEPALAALPAAVRPESTLPLKVDKPIPVPVPKAKPAKVPVAPEVPRSASAPPIEVASPLVPLMTLEQPALPGAWKPPTPLQELPRIGEADGPNTGLPPKPSDVPQFRSTLAQFEKPGGDALVLALLVNDQGTVVDSAIVVPSRFPLGDIAMTLTWPGKQWTDLDPPMLPGEYRWLELRIDQHQESTRKLLIP